MTTVTVVRSRTKGRKRRSDATLREAVDRVVAADNCSGCGLCAALSDQIEMRLDNDGYLRPVWVGGEAVVADNTVARFRASCPGVAVKPPQLPSVRRHVTFGPYVSAWSGWAIDEHTRHSGSSAGVLTALSNWLIESGRATKVVGAAASRRSPSRTVPVTIRSRSDALDAAGSRYAPVGVAAAFSVDPQEPAAAFVGKPCEAYAVRGAIEHSGNGRAPFIMSFFCAGVPSQHATEALVSKLAPGAEIESVRYRGNGWPGRFSVRAADGTVAEMDYEESWGRHLGPYIQSRCKICPDGTGEHADLSVGDFWRADEHGYPLFADSSASSAVIARTRRGHEALMAAQHAGIVELRPIALDEVAKVQPLQVRRRRLLLPRLIGRLLAGQAVPRVRGYRLLRNEFVTARSLGGFFTEFVSEVKGSRWRALQRRSRMGRRDVA